MKLKKLIKDLPGIEIKGPKDIDILGICNNSKLAAPGYLFLAKKGLTHSGNQFIAEAVAAGVSAVVTDLYDPFLQKAVQIVCQDVNAIEGILAERFYEYPSHGLLTIGITGTNGKTTTSYLIKHLLDQLGLPSGLIGTIECIVGENVFPSTQTTPDIVTNQKLFHDMRSVGCKSVVMEVSSHALDQNRVSHIDFDMGIFTNLTQDHLDYHKNMNEYACAKAKLFTQLAPIQTHDKVYPKVAIYNADSPWSETILKSCSCKTLSFGLGASAEIRAENLKLRPDGSDYEISYKGEKVLFSSTLIGKFNVYNCLAAFGVGLSLKISLSTIVEKLSTFQMVPGRLERVKNAEGKNIFVDYAHTDDALKNVLETLKEVATGKVICVFGCGGNRDRLKRPKMGKVAASLADQVFVTSDNPRFEDPLSIIQEILEGIGPSPKLHVEADRKKAIGEAIGIMKPEDILLIAGKGHETYQIFSHQTIHFDDRIVAKEYCQ